MRQRVKPTQRRKARECWVIWHKDSDRPAMYLGSNCNNTRAGVQRLLKNQEFRRDLVRIRRFVEREVKPTRRRVWKEKP